jgi:hypothetical protein
MMDHDDELDRMLVTVGIGVALIIAAIFMCGFMVGRYWSCT